MYITNVLPSLQAYPCFPHVHRNWPNLHAIIVADIGAHAISVSTRVTPKQGVFKEVYSLNLKITSHMKVLDSTSYFNYTLKSMNAEHGIYLLLNVCWLLKENCHHFLTYPKNLIKREKHGEKHVGEVRFQL